MAKVTVTLNEQQLTRLEQVVIDDDAEGALKLLKEIRRKLEADSRKQCDPVKLRASTTIQSATGNRED
ncbi:MAG: hypothetical protein AB1597_03570 [Chloroflexota bacterium]